MFAYFQYFFLQDFFTSLSLKDFDRPSKIGDYPEGEPSLRYIAPEIVAELNSTMPFGRYMNSTGPMNLVRIPFLDNVPLLYEGGLGVKANHTYYLFINNQNGEIDDMCRDHIIIKYNI